jgi:glycerol-1-phosphate dehydrogenase [NAD(P)+]
LGTLAAASLTEEVFKRKASDFNVKKRLETWPAWEKREAEIRGAFAHLPQALPQLIEINRKKFRTHEELLKRYQNLAELWAGLKKRVEAQLLPYEKLLRRFREAGCPTLPEEISLTRERFFRTFHRAQMLRDRFTVLDLAYELGILPDCVEAIQNSRRYFG